MLAWTSHYIDRLLGIEDELCLGEPRIMRLYGDKRAPTRTPSEYTCASRSSTP